MKLIYILVFVLSEVLTNNNHKEKEFNYNFQQNDYQVQFGRLELQYYNKDYFKSVTVRTFKYNRTCPAVNITFELKVDLGNDLSIIIQAYKFMSNEYRYFPIRFAVNACKAIKANMIGVGKLLHCGNFTGCPLLKHKVYHICNWTPDTEKFPPLIPDGDYKLGLQGIFHEQDVGTIDYYGSVSRPIAVN